MSPALLCFSIGSPAWHMPLRWRITASIHAGDAIFSHLRPVSVSSLQATAGSCKRCAAPPPASGLHHLSFCHSLRNPVSLRRVPGRDIETLRRDAIGPVGGVIVQLSLSSGGDASCPTVNVTTHRRVQPAFVDASCRLRDSALDSQRPARQAPSAALWFLWVDI